MRQAYPFLNRLLTSVILVALAVLLPLYSATATAAAVAIGKVMLATGEVWRLNSQGQEALQRHDPVHEGDHLQTGSGNLTLRMEDNALIALQPNSELIIHQYRAASENAEAAIRLELKQGNLRSRTGQIGQTAKHRYRLDTPFAALGIRGTDYTAHLRDNHLGIYVHSGAIRLAPFSIEMGCQAGQLGACNTPLAADLSADDNAWLSLTAGDSIKRISGTPDFVQAQKSSAVFTGGLYDAAGNLLEPSDSIQYRFEFVDDSDPLEDSLGTASTLAEETTPELPEQYLTDNSTTALSETQIRNYLRRTTLRMDTYSPLATHSIYNMRLTLNQQLQLNSWFDTRYQRLWGKTESLKTILAARDWPEGLFWRVLPESLDELGAQNTSWMQQLQLDAVPLWQLPLDQHSLAFTPGAGPDSSPDTQTFTARWSQPLGDAAGQASMASISGFRADSSSGRFQMNIRANGTSYTLSGTVGDAGTLFATNDYLDLRGHWEDDTLILLVTEKNSEQQWMFGLSQTGTSTRPLPAQWQQRQNNGVSWGHWADFASLDPEALSQLETDPSHQVSILHFVLDTPEIDNLPSSGEANFNLAAAEALYSSPDGLRPAQVLDPSLKVNFDQRSFVAQFDVAVPGLEDNIAILGAGQLDDQGLLQSDDRFSNSTLEGSLGSGGKTAALLFEHDLNDSDYVSGITHWQQ